MSAPRPNKLKSLFYVCTGGAGLFATISYFQHNEKFYDGFLLPILHCLPPETAHILAVQAHKYKLVPKSSYQDPPSLKTKLWGLEFCNPVGMAAGFDKDGEAVDNLRKIGFGFVEVGSVTPIPQPGNDKPRVFRLKENGAIINRYGFNSDGHEKVYERLKSLKAMEPDGIVGVNLGKNKSSIDPVDDYVKGIRRFITVADYLVINISSPNTEGLRDWQRKNDLEKLLSAVVKEVRGCWNIDGDLSRSPPPLLLKLAPDLSKEQLQDIVSVISKKECHVDGLIVCNTTTRREGGLVGLHRDEAGGLSGKPISEMSTSVISTLYSLTKGEVPIIGVGGVFTGQDAYDKILAGASLIQLYTSFVYHGPPRIAKIKKELHQLLSDDGFNTIGEAVGKGENVRFCKPNTNN